MSKQKIKMIPRDERGFTEAETLQAILPGLIKKITATVLDSEFVDAAQLLIHISLSTSEWQIISRKNGGPKTIQELNTAVGQAIKSEQRKTPLQYVGCEYRPQHSGLIFVFSIG